MHSVSFAKLLEYCFAKYNDLDCPQPLDFSTQNAKGSGREARARGGRGAGSERSEQKKKLRWRPVLSPFSPRAHRSKKHEKIEGCGQSTTICQSEPMIVNHKSVANQSTEIFTQFSHQLQQRPSKANQNSLFSPSSKSLLVKHVKTYLPF